MRLGPEFFCLRQSECLLLVWTQLLDLLAIWIVSPYPDVWNHKMEPTSSCSEFRLPLATFKNGYQLSILPVECASIPQLLRSMAPTAPLPWCASLRRPLGLSIVACLFRSEPPLPPSAQESGRKRPFPASSEWWFFSPLAQWALTLNPDPCWVLETHFIFLLFLTLLYSSV